MKLTKFNITKVAVTEHVHLNQIQGTIHYANKKPNYNIDTLKGHNVNIIH